MRNYNAAHVAVFNNKKQVLLIKRCDVPLWVLPGGRLEKVESFDNAAKREFREETGLKISLQYLAAIYNYQKNHIQKKLFIGKITGGKVKLGPESQDIGWFSVKKLPSPLMLTEKQRILDAYNYHSSTKIVNFSQNIFLEIINQLKNPYQFFLLLFGLIKSSIFNLKSLHQIRLLLVLVL